MAGNLTISVEVDTPWCRYCDREIHYGDEVAVVSYHGPYSKEYEVWRNQPLHRACAGTLRDVMRAVISRNVR